MKRWHLGTLLIVIMVFVTVGSTVLAFGPGGRHRSSDCIGTDACVVGPKGWYHGPSGVAADLNLSKEQMDKMWQTTEKFRTDTQKLRYELFQKRFEMKALFTDPKVDDAAIMAKEREISSLRQSMGEKIVQFRLAQRKILTPEQLQKLSEARLEPRFDGMSFGPGGRGAWGRRSEYVIGGGD